MRNGWLAAAAVVATAACSTVHVERNFDPNTDFKQFQTFAIKKGSITGAYEKTNEQLLTQHIEDELRQELVAKGWKEDANNPDVLVTYVGGARDRTELESVSAGVYGGYG